MLKDLGFSEGFHNQAHLGRRERAAAARVAVGGQTLFESGEMMYPLPQLSPRGIGRDIRTVEQGQLRPPVFFNSKHFHTTKLIFSQRIRVISTDCYRR